ncbi:MAG: guanylate kinase [Pseudomonadota bacterium]
MGEANRFGIQRRGLMLVLSSPSGAGKSTIARNLLEQDPAFELSVSVTTRERRGSEIEGVHYRVIDEKTFVRMRDDDEFIEHAKVHGNYYATPRAPVEEAMNGGRDMLFDIDVQGGLQMMEKVRGDVVSVFILPPSMAELEARLNRRAEDAPDVIAKRLVNAREEIEHWRDYDYVIINDDLDTAFAAVTSIIVAERLKRTRRPGLFGFVDDLLSTPSASES